jgi:cell volume regulation protein A
VEVAIPGLALALLLAVIARPLMAAICLLPFRYPARDIGYVGWVGLRGAVPIILAAYPVLAGAPGAERVFDIVFFVVVVGAFVPGATVSWLARRLGLEAEEPPTPQAVLEIESMQPLDGDLISFYIDEVLPVAGARLVDIPFPDGSSAMLIVRGRELIAPRGTTELLPGDHVYVFTRAEARGMVQLLFGRPETQ